MTPEEWKNYIDTGEVPMYFLEEMVNLIKMGESLTDRHLAIYQSHGKVIEMLLNRYIKQY